MAEVFRTGLDFHSESTKAVLEIMHEPSEDERAAGKEWNFLTIYGGGAKKASVSLGISLAIAKHQQAAFKARWPEITELHNPPWRNGEYPPGGPGAIQRQLARRGYITTLWGRPLHPEAPHKALNALIQGCAADLMRSSFVEVAHHIKDTGLESRIVNVVHDEIFLDCVDDEVPYLVGTIPALMSPTFIHKVVPIEVDIEISHTNWAEQEAYARDDGHENDLGLVGPRRARGTTGSVPDPKTEVTTFLA